MAAATMASATFLRRQQPAIPSLFTTSNKKSAMFGLKTNSGRLSRGGATMMATYKVTIITPEDGTVEFECPDDTYILEHCLDETGVDLPFSCKAGSCSSCAGKIISGTVDQQDGSFLEPEQMEAGWVLTCVAYPTSDVVIETHKEEELVG